MTNFKARLYLHRFFVFANGIKIYEQQFHGGLNIIRGDHAVGKSTLMDLIFYSLGGELRKEQWVYPADHCTTVCAEAEVNGKSFCFKRDIEVINRMFNMKIRGVASHGGMTGLNNLDFWKEKKASDFGLLYEAYDHQPEFNLFQEAFYVSDSEWTRWKCYNKGKLVEGDRRTFAEHAKDGHSLINILIHPDTYFDDHFYENEK